MDPQKKLQDELTRTSTLNPETGLYENTGSGTSENRSEMADAEAQRRARLDKAHADITNDTSDKSPGKKLAYHTDRNFSFSDIHDIVSRMAGKKTPTSTTSTNKPADPLLAAQKLRR